MCARPSKVGVSIWRKPQTSVFLDMSKDVVMSFCVAGVALCDIRRVSGVMCVCEAVVRVKFVSEDVLMSFCVAGVSLCDTGRVSGVMCVRSRREGKVRVSMGEATKTCLSPRVRRYAHDMLM